MNVEDVVLPNLGIVVASRSGSELLCHCPDIMGNHKHGDRNPSFTVNEDKLLYNCFVCGGGSLLLLVQDINGCDEQDALTWLEEHSNLAPLAEDEHVAEIDKIWARHREAVVPLPEYPADLLFQYEGIHSSLLERGISREVLIEKQVGWDDTHCGIVIPHFFEGRLVGIQTRHLAQAADGSYLCPSGCYQENVAGGGASHVPKYKNTDRFPRNRTLYNYDLAVAEGSGRVIVVESPMSVLYLMTHGYRNVVATFGAGLAEDQAALLRSFNDGVFFWPDNDPAGLLWFRRTKQSPPVQEYLEKYVPSFIIPAVPGDKADPGDVPPEEIPLYVLAAYPSSLYPSDGLRVGIPAFKR